MPAPYNTPGVETEEISTIAPSVAEVATAIPAFVGYTLKDDVRPGYPKRISSFADFEKLFGGPRIPDTVSFDNWTPENHKDELSFKIPELLLWHCMQMYFANGGGPCWVNAIVADSVTLKGLTDALKAFEQISEPTILVVPDAIKLSSTDRPKLYGEMLNQSNALKDRFCIFDAVENWNNNSHGLDSISAGVSVCGELRGSLPSGSYAAAYYPMLKCTPLLYGGLSREYEFEGNRWEFNSTGPVVKKTLIPTSDNSRASATANEAKFWRHIQNQRVLLPPSAAIAGVYADVDRNRGVWKAPGNVPLFNVVAPNALVSKSEHGAFNVSDDGKSINVIRSNSSGDVMVLGARTLDGNSNEWRFVSTRRFFIMVEESIANAVQWAVFEPNDANTWARVQSTIENFLTQKWREGALFGGSPSDAFSVSIGLGRTMTSDDMLQGIMNVRISMRVVTPAEVVVLKFSHKLFK